MTDRTRMRPDHRVRMIINNAVLVACDVGLANITYDNVAKRCPVATSASTVRHYFPTCSELQEAALAAYPNFHEQAVAMGLIAK